MNTQGSYRTNVVDIAGYRRATSAAPASDPQRRARAQASRFLNRAHLFMQAHEGLVASAEHPAAGENPSVQDGPRASGVASVTPIAATAVESRLSRENKEQRFEAAYLAALRLAGALIETGAAGVKRRPRAGAWDLLAKYNPSFAGWADEFRAFSPLRARMVQGKSWELSDEQLEHFEALVADFDDTVAEYYGEYRKVA